MCFSLFQKNQPIFLEVKTIQTPIDFAHPNFDKENDIKIPLTSIFFKLVKEDTSFLSHPKLLTNITLHKSRSRPGKYIIGFSLLQSTDLKTDKADNLFYEKITTNLKKPPSYETLKTLVEEGRLIKIEASYSINFENLEMKLFFI